VHAVLHALVADPWTSAPQSSARRTSTSAGSPSSTNAVHSSEENVEIVRRGFDLFKRGDLEAFLETIDPAIGWERIDLTVEQIEDLGDRSSRCSLMALAPSVSPTH
jgi:hypothetical protein